MLSRDLGLLITWDVLRMQGVSKALWREGMQIIQLQNNVLLFLAMGNFVYFYSRLNIALFVSSSI